jgi:DNA-directed RNA polymerase subunit N (RpoN/RPB10)
MNCITCNKIITGKYEDAFCGGYENYCYECGEKEAYKDYDKFLERQFEAELEREDPNFTDLYEIGDQFI